MTPEKAQSTVVTAMAVAAGVRLADDAVKHQTPSARTMIGLGFSTLVLAGMAVAAPALAAAFALLVVTASVFVYGGALWQQITQTLGK